MPQESWIAIRTENDVDVHALLSTYGFVPVGEERIANGGDPAAVRRMKRPPRGYVGFYVFEYAPWTMVLDGEGVLWEQLSTHALVSDLWSALVVVVIAKSTSDAFGFGLFDRGQMKRWVFRHGDVVGQSYGDPIEWETGAEDPAAVRSILRKRYGIEPELAADVRVLYARLAQRETRRQSFRQRLLAKLRRPTRSV